MKETNKNPKIFHILISYIDTNEIVWVGEPQKNIRIRFLKEKFLIFVILYAVAVFFFSFYLLYKGFGVLSFVTIFALYLGPFFVEALFSLREIRDIYVVTKDKIYFLFYTGDGYEVQGISVNDITDVKLVSYSDSRVGTIIFVSKPEAKFESYDYETGDKLAYPAFQYLEDVSIAYELIISRVKYNSSVPLLEQKMPLYKEKQLNIVPKYFIYPIKAFIIGLLFFQMVYAFDYGMLDEEEALVSCNYHSRNFNGCNYVTSNGLMFSTVGCPVSLKNTEVRVFYTSLFHIVTDFDFLEKKYKYVRDATRLSSSINIPYIRNVYWLSCIVSIISLIVLFLGRVEWDVVLKIVLAMIVFYGFLYSVWI